MIRKHLLAYGFRPPLSAENAEWFAKFDTLDTEFDIGSEIHAVKDINPNMLILGYEEIMALEPNDPDFTEVNLHEDWFLHDNNGQRIVNSIFGWYAMDVGNDGWRTWLANKLKTQCYTYPFDGVFGDDVLLEFPAGTGWNPWTTPIENIPISIQQRWTTDMIGMLQYIKNQIGNKLLIINCVPDATDYIAASDGYMDEEFVHPGRYSETDFYDEYVVPKAHVEKLDYWTQQGKIVLAQSGCKDTEPKEIQLYCLCAYMLGVNGSKSSFGWNSYWKPSKGYFPEMDTEIGNSRGIYYQVNPDVYERDFDHAKVFVNFSANITYTVDVERTPYSLPPHSGVIAPWEAPTNKGILEVQSFLDATEITAQAQIVGIGSYVTPFTLELEPGQYTLLGSYQTQQQSQVATLASGQTTKIDFVFSSPPTSVTLTITADANGLVFPTGTVIMVIDQSYQFQATPNNGYLFDHWDLGGENKGSSNPLILATTADMDGKTLTALFTAIPPTPVTVNIAISGNGTTDLAPGTHEFHVGDTITIAAIPSAGTAFKQWQLDGVTYTDNPLSLPVTVDLNGKTLTAEFVSIVPIQAGFPIWTIPVGIAILIGGYALSRKGKNRKG